MKQFMLTVGVAAVVVWVISFGFQNGLNENKQNTEPMRIQQEQGEQQSLALAFERMLADDLSRTATLLVEQKLSLVKLQSQLNRLAPLTDARGRVHDQHMLEGQAVVEFACEKTGLEWLNMHPEYSEIKHDDSLFLIKSEHYSTQEMLDKLADDVLIIAVDPNFVYEKQSTASAHEAVQEAGFAPNDEFFRAHQWNLKHVAAEKGWNISAGNQDVVIAILDTGVDIHHQDLASKIVSSYNAMTEDTDVTDIHGHGTHVAGVAAAATNNETGIAGLNWNSKIMPVKVLDAHGEGSLYDIVKGIIWATDNGADIINLSLGDEHDAEILHDAVRYAYEHDVVLVAAAGNENTERQMFPAAYSEVIAVAALDTSLKKAFFSNYGEHIDCTAPGEHIPSTFPENQYVYMSGTSMAAPHVAGLAALIRSYAPQLTNKEVTDVILSTATDLGQKGFDAYYGHGLMNVYQALQSLAPANHEDSPAEADDEVKMNGQVHPLVQLGAWFKALLR